ncbi:MAG TPA: MFS transporter, partial [Chitinophagaceae bacterium]
ACILLMKLPPTQQKKHAKNILQDVRDGWKYLNETNTIKFTITMLALISLFVLPFTTLIPVYAKDIFKGTAATFGIIDSVIGLGAFSGAIFLASLKPERNLRKILAVNTVLFGVGLALFSYMRFYPAALVCAMLTGFGMMSQITISNTLIQTTVSPHMRGRMISFYAMAFFGMQPVGGLIVGSISQWIGVPTTVLAQGCIAILIGVLHFRFLKRNKLKTVLKNIQPIQPAEAAAS